ncbi:MAG TPA: DUF6597 domain-containing transcriptional factor [Bryobacteraceae bacterium]|nr:DUF6597 domain-containing transcriptional factor [Bryobacteraceae bacterium]
MAEYREIAPPPRIAEAVECFWIMRQSRPAPEGAPLHRVVPDGCADILFTANGGAGTLNAVGPMTGFRDHPVPPGGLMVGVRFRPGMWRASLGVPGDRLTDGIVRLDDLWGSRARELLQRLGEASSPDRCAAAFESFLRPPGAAPVQRAVAWMERRRGCVSVDELARMAGLSARQFRRACLSETGLTPKFLARVLRFRHVLSRVETCASFADLALDCGYYDQAHCINEFREFAGRTPASGRFFQSRQAPPGVG